MLWTIQSVSGHVWHVCVGLFTFVIFPFPSVVSKLKQREDMLQRLCSLEKGDNKQAWKQSLEQEWLVFIDGILH